MKFKNIKFFMCKKMVKKSAKRWISNDLAELMKSLI